MHIHTEHVAYDFVPADRRELKRGDWLEVRMSPHPLPTVNRKNFTGDWLDSLRAGFMYNVRKRQKPR